MKKAIITGANSFIGYRLCRLLAEQEYFVYAVIRRNNHNNVFLDQKNIKLIYCDMENYNNLSSKIDDICDVGITMSWNGTRGSLRNDKILQETNLRFSLDCINSFIQLGCKKIMTAGSQAEYGPWNENRKITENDICRPNTQYGIKKLEFYNKTKELCEKNNITILEPRFFSLYGEDDNECTMIISMIRNMLKNKKCELTKCIQLWDFLYIDDAVDGLYKLIESESANGIYNFGSGESKYLKEYVMEMYELTHSKSELCFGSVPYPATGMVNTNPDITKLQHDIKWWPKVSFEEGIKKIIEKQI